MRESGYSLSKENSQQPKDIRGGEKKVMKKSLSAILSLAMAFSMFSSVAFGADDAAADAAKKKSSADFDDLKDLTPEQKAIFDQLIGAEVFDGVGEKTFGLKDKMNRAQFAKVAALIFKLDVDKSKSTSSFSDVKAEDPANGYALPYIEALKAAGLTDGYAPGQYNPAGEVTKQELATFLIRGLGWEADAKASTGVSDKTVSDWAKGYVAVAIEKKILTSGADGTFGGTSAATRDILVLASYEAEKQYVPQGKVSVTEAKASGYNQVTVSFNKPVDTDKAKFSLKKGTLDLETTAKFSDDKKSAVLTLKDGKINAGSYSVAVTGVDAIDKSTAEFTAEDEKLVKLSFVNPSEKIAKSPSVTVKVKAENQYGESSSITGGSYTALAGGESVSVKRNEDTGFLELELNTSKRSNGTEYTSELDVVPINIYLTNSNISAQKTLKVSTEPIVSKIELGTPKYSTGGTTLTGDGEYVELPITRYDQFGDIYKDNDKFVGNYQGLSDRLKAEVTLTPWSDEALTFDKDSAKKDKLRINLSKNIDKAGDYTATVYVSGASATATLSVKSSKIATSVDFGTAKGVLAVGDKDKYIPIIAYDAAGNKLSPEDIVDNAKNNRFTISVSGANVPSGNLNGGNNAIVQSGEHKGEIKLSEITAGKGGVVYINLGIYTANVQVNKYQQLSVQEARVAETVKVQAGYGEPKHRAAGVGAESKVKWVVYDQHGEVLDQLPDANKDNYRVVVSVTDATYVSVNRDVTKDGATSRTINGADFENEFNGKEFVVKTTGVPDDKASGDALKPVLKATLQKKVVNASNVAEWTNVKTEENEVRILKKNDKLTYSVGAVKDLYAALDSGQTNKFKGDSDNANYPTAKEYANGLGRGLSVNAKDASGNDVALPPLIVAVSSQDNNVVHAVYNNGFKWNYETDAIEASAGDNNKARVVGNKPGSTTVTVSYKTLDGDTKESVVNVVVKNDQVKVASLKARNSKVNTSAGVQKAAALQDLLVVDNYGIEYDGDKINAFKNFTGVIYSVNSSDIEGNGTVTVDNNTGKITIGAGVTKFILRATTGTFSASTTVTVK
ncbi:S-layer homology domain-containing protein [Paenibacillus filicis]|uniref:S-layer homology domain-containing protein n=1 Tax=Paenibacillus filicis TaxID=669464 RepID=A0ABU9DS63_9BACL